MEIEARIMKKIDFFLLIFLAILLFLWSQGESIQQDVQELQKPDLSFSDIQEVILKQKHNRLRFSRGVSNWILTDYKRYPIKTGAVESLLSRLSQYSPGPLVGQDEAAARVFRVDDKNPHIRVELKGKNSKIWTLFLSPAMGDSDYVRLAGDEKIYQLEPALSRQLSLSPKDWIDPYLYHLQGAPEKIVWSISGREYRITFDGRQFSCRDFQGQRFPLDSQKVISFIQDLQALPIDQPVRFLKSSPIRPSPMMLFFEVPGSGKSVRLNIFPRTDPITGVRGYRVWKSGDPREVFVLAHRFKGLFDNDVGIFLPGDVVMNNR
jgi:hypothetical protein